MLRPAALVKSRSGPRGGKNFSLPLPIAEKSQKAYFFSCDSVAFAADISLQEKMMNRNLVSALALVSMLALLGGCNEEAQPQKPAPQFGVVQVAKIYQESRLGKQGVARVGELEDKAMAVFTDLQAKLEKARADKNEAEVQKLEKDLQSRVYFLQNVIKQDQEHVMNVLQTEMKKAFDQCRTDNGLLGLFTEEVLPSYSPEVDVTDKVKAILDAGTADFGELPSLDMPALPEPANATKAEEAAPAEEAAAPEAAPEAPAAPASK